MQLNRDSPYLWNKQYIWIYCLACGCRIAFLGCRLYLIFESKGLNRFFIYTQQHVYKGSHLFSDHEFPGRRDCLAHPYGWASLWSRRSTSMVGRTNKSRSSVISVIMLSTEHMYVPLLSLPHHVEFSVGVWRNQLRWKADAKHNNARVQNEGWR